MPRLLNPKVICRNYELVTLADVKRIIAAGKSKRCGMKDFAVEVEEVELTECTEITVPSRFNRWPETKILNPGSYFNVRLEYIV